jgi:hypothetical protein
MRLSTTYGPEYIPRFDGATKMIEARSNVMQEKGNKLLK